MSVWQRIMDILTLSRLSRRWRIIGRVLSVAVVFCTTYMLILPAITMENITYCGFDAHIHTESCYSDNVQVCSLVEHSHTEKCFIESLNTNTDAVMLMATDEPEATAQKVAYSSLDGSGATYYIVYSYYNGGYYALDGNGNAVEITVASDGSVTASSMTDDLFWNFSSQGSNSYIIQNRGTTRYMHSYDNTSEGVTTAGAYPSTLVTGTSSGETFFSVKSNSDYSQLQTSSGNVVFTVTQTASSAAKFYLAEVTLPELFNVWFDGTCGGLMSLYESDNIYRGVYKSSPYTTLPLNWKSPSKYDYVINGWYDIKNHSYHKPGEIVEITQDTVFYADWVAKTYDVGQNNSHVVASLDTNSFIRTDMFDYSAVFNFQAVTHTGTVSATSHSETWSVVQNDNVPYNNEPSIGFIFRDWDSGNKHISYAANRARLNDNQGTEITSQITDYVYNMSGKDIIDILFNPQTKVIGKTHVGEGNYLYQFMEQGSSNYDGIHNGYYYYDATLNAASFNQTDKRFYIYDYLERTSDSLKDSFDSSGNPTAAGAYSDFLPFNSPYANNSNNKTIVDYADKNGNYGNHQYDAKSAHEGSAAENAGTNYWYGMKSEIQFYLPNDTGTVDAYGNYGNISSHGEHMNFQFHGDDDLWVFIDGELVMDIGGLHGIMDGTIDFSTGTVTTDYAENNDLVATPTSSQLSLKEGDHTLTIYYMERGGSQANCAIYFNITPRYAMEITKQDSVSGEKLDGAEFSVFTDSECTVPAELWHSEQDYEDGEPSLNTFTVNNGKAYFWGVSAGKLYYIKETKAPDGYPLTDDIIRVAMNNLGGSVCTTDSLRGENGEHTDGFDVLTSDSDEALHLITVTVTNQTENQDDSDLGNIRVSKTWADGSENIPDSVTVWLNANGEATGKSAVLSQSNNWTYTWTGLPLTAADGTDIVYSVSETQVAGFTTSVGESTSFSDSSMWLLSENLRDGDVFLIVNKSSGNALSVSSGSFTWISSSAAQSNTSAQWTAIADGMGFHLINGDGYRIILNGTSEFVPSQDGNRILYYYDSKLFAQNGNIYYYMGDSFSASSESGAETEIYKKTDTHLSGELFEITNTPIPEDEQTYLNVLKNWQDGSELHTSDSIVVRLYADGKDTGRTLTLDKSNSWAGVFDGLAYYSESGAKVSYTVKENPVSGYMAEYSAVTETPGENYTEWNTASAFESGGIYRFVYNGYALASNSSNSLVGAVDDSSDTYQQWEYTGSYLKNVATGRYLYISGSSLSLNQSSGSAVTLTSGKLRVGSRYYVRLSSTTVSSTNRSNSATTFTVSKGTQVTKLPYFSLTVTNTPQQGYLLPETGGSGVYMIYTVGVILILSSVGIYVLSRRKRKIQ